MPDLNDLMKQAGKMQEQMQKAQEELSKQEVVGESGAGMVRVTMNGRHDVRNIAIDDALLKEDKSMLEDLVAAAVNDAVRRVEESNKNALGKMFSGTGMPAGFKMPF
ncbi:MAG TPA: YbaB/EbfC family nucleoid-associated protein [Spongiibacteraceae bacterium]|nr:YbaB/EbfC family nucleoid-associated protein [Spongiibacteraceae bacterium]HCS27731.1 YbaB/EbfC family nucleoid-associated protein [Spongiibacteraceae bacterium]